jgi:hypothetical protein
MFNAVDEQMASLQGLLTIDLRRKLSKVAIPQKGFCFLCFT